LPTESRKAHGSDFFTSSIGVRTRSGRLSSYTFKGALGSARYYESLTPFVCISAAYGASTLGARWRPAMPLAVATVLALVWPLVAGTWTFTREAIRLASGSLAGLPN
jgi:hypothetical protein